MPVIVARVWALEITMGLLDGVLGGVVGAGLTQAVSGYIEKNGGLQGVLAQFEKHGLGDKAQSWIGKGANLPISPDQVKSVIGPDLLQQLSAKTGLSVGDLAQKLAQVLPQAVDKMTPDGVIPKA
jgi:uncharacterized protein YidB (DUF937 family)